MSAAVAFVSLIASFEGAAARTERHDSSMTPPCRAPDAATTDHLHYLRLSSSGSSPSDVGWRAGTKVPFIADTTSAVVVVSDSTLCRRALDAYRAMVSPDSTVTEIELLKADTVFVASHPDIHSGEFVGRHVFNQSFQHLGSYLK